MNPLTQFKKILILPLLIALALVALARPRRLRCRQGTPSSSGTRSPRTQSWARARSKRRAYIYMAYTSAAVYDAAVAIDGGFEPYGPPITAPPGASVDCAVVEAAYRTLVNYFPFTGRNSRRALRRGALELRRLHRRWRRRARLSGDRLRTNIIALRTGDGRMTPIGTTSSFPTLPPGPGVWRLTPPFPPPQTPWVGNVRRFILQSVDQFLPDPPPSLQSPEWVEAFDEVKAYGAATGSARTRRADLYREVLVGERDPPVQPGRARHRRRARPWPARDCAVSGDDQRRRRRCS